MNYVSGHLSVNSSLSLLDTLGKPMGKLTTEDRGMAAVSTFFVDMPEHFWALLCTVGIVLVVAFLSKVRMDSQGEDMSVYQVFPLAVLWSSLGIALIVLNKFIFLPVGVGFGFPHTIFLMWWHALAGTIATNILRRARPDMMPAASEQTLSVHSYFINIFPIAGLQAAALALGNTAYLHISVAYIQMVKNTTSAFVFMFSIMLGLERGTFSTTLAVIMVVAGLLLTTVGELDFTLLGFMFQMGGTLSDSLRLSLTKIVLSSNHAVKLDPMSALYFSSPTMLVILSVPAYLIDFPHLTLDKLWNLKFVMITNALLAFGLNMTSMFFMKRCGATTYALTGVLKDVALILLCCAIFGHPMGTLQAFGFIVSLIGFQLYNNLKTDGNYLVNLSNRIQGLPCEQKKGEATPLITSPEDGTCNVGQLPRSKDSASAAGGLCLDQLQQKGV